MNFSVNCLNKAWPDWQPNKSKQSCNGKNHGKKINESANFTPEIIKISSDKTHQQHFISKLRNIRVKNVNVIIGTLSVKIWWI